MSRPLRARREAQDDAAAWHRAVFAAYGPWCVLCLARAPQTRVRATDAAHVIPRSILGTALAYASPRLGKPLCRACHDKQGLGLDPAYRFSYAIRLDAALAHNEVAKSKLPLPECDE